MTTGLRTDSAADFIHFPFVLDGFSTFSFRELLFFQISLMPRHFRVYVFFVMCYRAGIG